jgi:hypothetical protein
VEAGWQPAVGGTGGLVQSGWLAAARPSGGDVFTCWGRHDASGRRPSHSLSLASAQPPFLALYRPGHPTPILSTAPPSPCLTSPDQRLCISAAAAAVTPPEPDDSSHPSQPPCCQGRLMRRSSGKSWTGSLSPSLSRCVSAHPPAEDSCYPPCARGGQCAGALPVVAAAAEGGADDLPCESSAGDDDVHGCCSRPCHFASCVAVSWE